MTLREEVERLLDELRTGRRIVGPDCETVPLDVAGPGYDTQWKEFDLVLPVAKFHDEGIAVEAGKSKLFFTKAGKVIVLGTITGWTFTFLVKKAVQCFRYAQKSDLRQLSTDQWATLRTALVRLTRKTDAS